MDLSSLRTLVSATAFETLGVDATITRPHPDNAPITTRIVWMSPLRDDYPAGADFHRREAVRALAVRRDEVPTVPRGTIVTAPDPEGGALRRWRVEAPDRVDTATVRVIVVPEPDVL